MKFCRLLQLAELHQHLSGLSAGSGAGGIDHVAGLTGNDALATDPLNSGNGPLADGVGVLEGLDVIVGIIQPSVIVIYGTANNKYFGKYKERGIQIVQFDGEFASSHKKEVQ